MSKKSIIAILSAVVLMVVASLALVFTMGPKTSAVMEYDLGTLESKYLDISSDGKIFNGLNEAGKNYIFSNAIYRIEIPDGIITIGEGACRNLSGLKSVLIPEGVVSIGHGAFYGCTKLTSVVLPDSLINCDRAAFGHTGLTSITFGCNLTSIGYEMFSACYNLKSITLPNGITNIGPYAFNNCKNLQSITLPASLTSIGTHAFSKCENLKQVNYWGEISQWVQINFSSDEASSNPTCIAGKLLIKGEEFTEAVISEGVTRINSLAFYNCKNLASIVLPKSLTSIGEMAFYGCGLKSMNYLGTIDDWTQIEFGFYSYTSSNPVQWTRKLVIQGEEITEVVISDNVSKICNYAFYYCRNLKSIIIPKTVNTIGSQSFYECSNLKEIIVQNPDLMNDPNLQSYVNSGVVHYGDDQNTVTFNTTGGTSIPDQLIVFGEFVEEPSTEKAGYHLSGWYLDENYTKPFTFDTPIKYNITLYAKWQVAVVFDSNGGSDVSSVLVDCDDMLKRPSDPSRAHYTFLGWYLSGELYVFNTPVTEEITLVAEWIKNPIITFDTDGGTEIAPREITYNTTITSPTSIKTGYKFLGWYLNDEPYNFSTPVTEDITLVAEWEKLCVVTFDTDGGYEIEPQYVEKNGYAYFPWTSKAYHDLVGWKLNGAEFDFNNTSITEDITLVADWEIYTYEVIFDSNGGTAVPSQVIEHGAKVMIPTDPTRDGYFFCGWYRISFSYSGSGYSGNKTTVTEYDFETPVTEYMTLTAVWKKIYNVTFANANGEVYTTRAVVEGDLVQAPDITVDGYLVSWYAGDKAYDFTTPVTADMTLTAQLDENSVKVNNQNNNALIWGIAGTAAGILIIGGIVFGIVISKRRRK